MNPSHRVSHLAPLLSVFCLALLFAAMAQGQGSQADYDRAWALGDRYAGTVARDRVRPHWVSDSRFWYRVNLGDGRHQFMMVDADTGERRPAFDHVRVADALGVSVLEKTPAPDRLPLQEISFHKETAAPTFSVEGKGWFCWDEAAGTLDAHTKEKNCQKLKPWQPPKPPRFNAKVNQTSPDGRWYVQVRDNKLILRDLRPGDAADKPSGSSAATNPSTASKEKAPEPIDYEKAIATGHNARFRKTIAWAPDSSCFVAVNVVPGDGRVIHLIESSPKDQLQGKLHVQAYAKPGDNIDQGFPRLFPVGDAEEIPIDHELFDNPWSIQQFRWDKDASRFTFLYNQRGHQTMRVVAVDAKTGQASAIIDEQSDTFIEYSRKQFSHYLDDAGEIVWMSERDGWNHLYLIDNQTGEVKRQLTRGPWVVRRVVHVDEQARTVIFTAGGIYGDQDPYHEHFCRVDLDTGALTRLTAGDGNHTVRWSPNGKHLIATYSRVDLPPVTELRRTSDGSLVCELERADATALVEAGWRSPERFVAKGRDGKTDIYGIILRPSNFDPNKKYPVVEEHYAGPHWFHTPKSFAPVQRGQDMAELGFIVCRMDGMGTSGRSKAFHDVCHKNLQDGGFPDRIAWLKAAAEHEPAMDLTRVGIRGTSAGGQTGMAAMLWHNDFYKVCVSNCGCHDNRVDKIWWNELWMGWPIGPHYAAQSNTTNAHRLKGDLLLIVGEMDRNVDPVSTLQVVDALMKADKDFEMLLVPGGGHGARETNYARRRTWDFLLRNLHQVEPRRE